MHVEHYDADTQTVNVLQDELLFESEPVTDDVIVKYRYWCWKYDQLKKRYAMMGRCKERQQVALDRDAAQTKVNTLRRAVFG